MTAAGALPPRLIAVLGAALQEMHTGNGEPTLKHLYWILDEVRIAVSAAGRDDLAEVPFRLIEAFTDVIRGGQSRLFTPSDPRHIMPTWKVNMIAFALRAVDEAVSPESNNRQPLRVAIRRVLPIIRRRMPCATATTVMNWRREAQRKDGSALPDGVFLRYQQAVPDAGTTPEARHAYFLDLLDRLVTPKRPRP